MTPARKARNVTRVMAVAPLSRRLDACRRFGIERELEHDPIGKLLDGYRDTDGLEIRRETVPLGVVGLVQPDLERIADCIIAGNATVVAGFDVADVRNGLADAGLPEDAAVPADEPPDTEIDALMTGDELIIAERVGSHASIYVDAEAEAHQVTYVAVNAVAHACVDALVLHEDFDTDAARDVEEALSYMGKDPDIVLARSIVDAAQLIEARSSGRVETIISSNVSVIREFASRVDSAALVINVSPAFAGDLGDSRELVGLTRARTVIQGDGQTKPLPSKSAPAE